MRKRPDAWVDFMWGASLSASGVQERGDHHGLGGGRPGTLFLGITMPSHLYGLLPREGETLVSQLARQVLGAGPLYYLVQAATMLILILASNTSFADFPCLAYIGKIREKDPDGWVTVLLPEVIPARWWQNLLHNQRALIIRAALLFTPGVIVTAVPYHLER